MVVISNSSPIIHLAKIGRLNLLERLYSRILIPEKVYLECTDTVQYHTEVELITQSAWIKRYLIEDDRLFNLFFAEIDAGEAESLVLALEQKADLLLLDDQEARSMARKLGLPVTGTLGVLLKAKNEGMINSFAEDLQKLQRSGFWLSQDLVNTLLSSSGPNG
jgi:predicted nucleic acid-binding protein